MPAAMNLHASSKPPALHMHTMHLPKTTVESKDAKNSLLSACINPPSTYELLCAAADTVPRSFMHSSGRHILSDRENEASSSCETLSAAVQGPFC